MVSTVNEHLPLSTILVSSDPDFPYEASLRLLLFFAFGHRGTERAVLDSSKIVAYPPKTPPVDLMENLFIRFRTPSLSPDPRGSLARQNLLRAIHIGRRNKNELYYRAPFFTEFLLCLQQFHDIPTNVGQCCLDRSSVNHRWTLQKWKIWCAVPTSEALVQVAKGMKVPF